MTFQETKVRKAQKVLLNVFPIPAERLDSFCNTGVVLKYNTPFQMSIKRNVEKAKMTYSNLYLWCHTIKHMLSIKLLFRFKRMDAKCGADEEIIALYMLKR